MILFKKSIILKNRNKMIKRNFIKIISASNRYEVKKMRNVHFNTKLINILKDILLRLNQAEALETIQEDFDQHFNDVSSVEILLIVHELKSGDHGITSHDVMKLFHVYTQLYGHSITDLHVPESHHPGHPVQIFKEEN